MQPKAKVGTTLLLMWWPPSQIYNIYNYEDVPFLFRLLLYRHNGHTNNNNKTAFRMKKLCNESEENGHYLHTILSVDSFVLGTHSYIEDTNVQWL